jgi:radical SAM superfamily enzyme YgiQ (UPF0313 family)
MMKRSGKMKALLVYPEFPNTYWSFKHALPFAGKRSAFPPLGLMTISAMMPDDWQKRLVDLNCTRLKDSDIEWADMVFASAMMVQQDSLREVIDRCKRMNRAIAVGGPFVTTGAEHVADADHIFLGEAEHTLPEFLRDLSLGVPQHVYESDEKPDLTRTPVPDFKLVDMRRYSSMAIQYSRGCPFNCEFCDIIEIYGRVPRTKTNRQVLAELDALYRANWRGPVFIVDDNFIGNKRNVRRLMPDLCEWMERHEHPFRLFTEASVNLADDDELLGLMQRANFRKVFLGIETPVEESLKETQKNQNTRRSLIESVRKIQSHGMEVMAGFIVGFDNDPVDIFQRQIDFIRQSAIPMAMVGLLSALPETQLWRRLQQEGRLLGAGAGTNTEASLNFITKMDRQTLIDGYKTILRTIYSPEEYYARVYASLKHTISNRTAYPLQKFRPAHVLHFFRVFFKLGLFDSARSDFWRFLRRVVAERRELLPEAVVLAVMGYHFRKITEQYCDRAQTA